VIVDQTPYTYLFIRKDLSFPQQLVQIAHAAHDAGYEFGDHSHMCVFEISGEQKLLDAASYLDDHSIPYRMFHETDIGQHTAICTTPITGDTRKALRKFKMYRESSQITG
jgi:hypothetical protein